MIGEPLPSENNWAARREIIDRLPEHTVKQLRHLYDDSKISLGVVRPIEILDLIIEPADREWKPSGQNALKQIRLWGESPKPLEKIPFKFSHIFECKDSLKPHKTMIEDWELGVLFLKERDRLGNEERAANSVKEKYLNEMCGSNKDTRFFMGTTFPYNSWVVVGVFWPPQINQLSLF